MLNKLLIRIPMNRNKQLIHEKAAVQENGFGIKAVHKKIYKPGEDLAQLKDGNVP